MTPEDFRKRIVRYGELIPCKTAFIDAHTPGSDRKENFTIIGGGVSESADQHVHIKDTPGFNIGAAGQPPKCRNSLHTHRTAEVFFVLKGRWRFFWGRKGDTGEVILEEGDIFNIPTGMFRGFENIGTDYGMIMAILGGDDAGGGVIWAPEVIEDAKAHGLILGNNGKLYDSKQGKNLPDNVQPMPVMNDENLALMMEPSTMEVVPNYVARYLDLWALADKKPVEVIAENGIIRDRPGFTIEFLRSYDDAYNGTPYQHKHATILMPVRGYWRIEWEHGKEILNPGDTCAVPTNFAYSLKSSMSGEASLYRILGNDEPAGITWRASS